MKNSLHHLALALGLVAATFSFRANGQGGGVAPSPAPSTNAAATAGGPRIQFENPTYDFGRAKGGEAVKHDFVFTNTGDALLEITGAQPSCGCTTAGDWSRKVEPGKTGIIPVQFNTGNYNGDVTKTVTVSSNDKEHGQVILTIHGNVWRPVDVMPNIAYMTVNSETVSNASTAVRIVNNEPTPLTLSAPESNNRLFHAEVTTNQPGKDYSLLIKTVPPMDANNLAGVVTLKTSSTNTPTVSVTVYAIMQQAVVTAPDKIMLPQGPLTNGWQTAVSIRNQMTSPLTISDAAVNAEGVTVKVNELDPGRVFNITLTFPAGFKIAPADKLEFKCKSNNPQFQTIRIPILPSPVLTKAFSPAVATPPPALPEPALPVGRSVPLTTRAEQAVKAAEGQ